MRLNRHTADAVSSEQTTRSIVVSVRILLWGELDFFTPAATVLSATCSMEGECHAKSLHLFDPTYLMHTQLLVPYPSASFETSVALRCPESGGDAKWEGAFS